MQCISVHSYCKGVRLLIDQQAFGRIIAGIRMGVIAIDAKPRKIIVLVDIKFERNFGRFKPLALAVEKFSRDQWVGRVYN